jgi:hypothetical protein
VIVAHRHTQYGSIARAGFAQHWRILASELRQWYAMDTSDFFWICRRQQPSASPNYYGSHDVSGPSDKVIKTTKYMLFLQVNTNLFRHLSQRRSLGRLSVIHSSTG